MKLAALTVDPTTIEGGEWIGDLPECGDLRIRTRGLSCAAFQRAQSIKIAALPRSARRANRIDPEVMRGITIECVASACLLDWENLADDTGPIPFSTAKALELAADPRYRPLHDAWVAAASQVGEARDDDNTDAVGNLPKGSIGA